MNKFELLPEADQQFIFGLCEKHIYAEAVKILAQPRPVGLSIVTSVSTLCRFNTRHSRDCHEAEVLGQYAESLRVRREATDGAQIAGILATVENRILACLKNGAALKDLTQEFRILASACRSFNAQDQWRRAQKVPKHHYHKHVNNTAANTDPDCDFIAPEELRSEANPGFENPDSAWSAEDNDEIQASALPLPTREDPNPFAKLLAKAQAYGTRKAEQNSSQPAASEEQPIPNGTPGVPLIQPGSLPQNSPEPPAQHE